MKLINALLMVVGFTVGWHINPYVMGKVCESRVQEALAPYAEQIPPTTDDYEVMYGEESDERDDIVRVAAERAKFFEGFSSEPYELWGTWHIGYGTTVADPTIIDYISEQDAYQLMLTDMYDMYDALSDQWPIFDDLIPEYQVVLVDMAYNMGIPRLMQFTDLQECTNVACTVAEIEDSLYYDQVTNRAMANVNYIIYGDVND